MSECRKNEMKDGLLKNLGDVLLFSGLRRTQKHNLIHQSEVVLKKLTPL